MSVKFIALRRAPVAGLCCLCLLPLHAAAADPAEQSAEQLSEVVVTASPISHDADRFATIVETVSRERILQQGGATLADALANTPGVSGSGFAAGASRPVIRGFDANRVRLLEDGIGSFDVSDIGPDHGVPIDPLSARRVEVVRGAATLRYGSQAIGGVVNAINDRVPTQAPDGGFAGEITGAHGSGSSAQEMTALLDGGDDRFAWHADGFRRVTDDYQVPRGRMSNSWTDSHGGALGGSWFSGDSRIGAAVVRYESDYGIPGEDAYITMRQTKGMLRGVLSLERGAWQMLNIDGGIADYEHSEIDPAAGAINATFRDREWDLRAEAVAGPAGPMSGAALGLQLQQRRFSALGEAEDYMLPTDTRSAAVFAFTELPLGPRAHIEAGARVESVRVQGTDVADRDVRRTLTPTSLSVGGVFDASDTIRLGLLASSAARAPVQTELFARGPHDGPRTFEVGDSSLAVERGNSLEASVRLRSAPVNIDLSLWGTRFSNYVYGQLSGRTCDEDGNCVDDDSLDLRELLYRQLDARFRGAELKARFPLHQSPAGQLSLEVTGDVVRAELADGSPVPRMPPWHLGGSLTWSGPHLDAGVTLRHAAQQTRVPDGDTPTDAYTSLDAFIGWSSAESRGLGITLAGHNLGNSEQRNAVAFNRDEVMMPGRDLRLVFRYSF